MKLKMSDIFKIPFCPFQKDTTSSLSRPTIRDKGNTGVKGVLADYAAYQEMKRVEAEMENLKAEWAIKKMALSSTVGGNRDYKQEEEEKDDDVEERKERDRMKEEKESEELLLDDDGDEFWEKYKKQRTDEIRSAHRLFAH
jgi:TATA-binding protein-associated factor Taf7